MGLNRVWLQDCGPASLADCGAFTLLDGAAGLSEAMLRPGSWTLGDKGTHYIRTIKNSSNHLATLINDILDAASMAKGKLVIKNETVSCDSVLLSCISNNQLAVKGSFSLLIDHEAADICLMTS